MMEAKCAASSSRVASPLVPVRVRRFGEDVLLTNPWGDWVFVTQDQFATLERGALDSSSDLANTLTQRGFIRAAVDPSAMAQRVSRKRNLGTGGPFLHVVIPTLRCNQTCVYCHASRTNMADMASDMSVETADKVVEFIFQTTSPQVTIEFQGGEPLANFLVVRHIIERAMKVNESHGKRLSFSLVSNLSLMDEEKLGYLLGKRVQICTSLDGPAELHDKNRLLSGGPGAHAFALHWMQRINKSYAELGLDPLLYHVEALFTATRHSLAQPRQIVDAYVKAGCHAIFLRPLDPFGFAAKTVERTGYEGEAYLEFYREALAYIIELNRQGVQVLERFAAIFLTKILTEDDPNYLDIRSPCGAGIGQVAYNHDGTIFTCDEGRMLHQMGDSFFAIGNVKQDAYRPVILGDTVRALMLASNLDAQPECNQCVYQPYCGVCPVHNYATQGSIFGRMRESTLCATYKGIQDYLFGLLHDGDPTTVEILRRWTTLRARDHFVHKGVECDKRAGDCVCL